MTHPATPEEWALSEYVHSDYFSESERDAEADIPLSRIAYSRSESIGAW